MSVGPVPWKNVVKNAAAEKLFAEIQALPVLLKQFSFFYFINAIDSARQHKAIFVNTL